jgi:DnaJ-class molecular chaperone
MPITECKKCKGTGIYSYETKTGLKTRTCKVCKGRGTIEIVYENKMVM